MKKLLDIVKTKDMSVLKGTSVNDAVELMYTNNEGCIVVLDKSKAVGILTERDIIAFMNEYTDTDQDIYEVTAKSVIGVNSDRTVEYALHILIDNNIRRLVVLDSKGLFLGIVTQEMIINNLEEEHYRVNLKVSQVISSLDKDIVTLDIDSKLSDSISMIYDNAIGSVLISSDKKIVGIITERDVVRLMSSKTAITTPIKDVMSSPVISVSINDSVKYIADMMNEKRIRRVVVKDVDGNAVGVIGTRDIIKNIKGNYGVFVENKLKYTKEALNAINEVIFELYSEHDKMLIQWGNAVALKRYGVEVIDSDITQLIDKEQWSKITDVLVKENKIDDYKVSIKDQMYLLSCSQCNVANNTKAFFIICKDVTEYEVKLLDANKDLDKRVQEEIQKNKEKERQFMEQSRLAQMGEMISMIAHQWRQPLSVISSTAINLDVKIELDKFDLTNDEEIEKAKLYFQSGLKKIEKYVQSLTTTIDDFRNFYKPNKLSVNSTFEDIVSKSMGIIEASLRGDDIELIFDYKSKEILNIYDGEMMQVILNILKNAQDNFKTSDIKDKYIKISTNEKSLSICDNGGGISEDILPNIFDPYFSTKDEKNGTGLGLYMSKTIVEEHHKGTLHVENKNDGVCFKINLDGEIS